MTPPASLPPPVSDDKRHHFLLVTIAAKGQTTPALRLAAAILHASGGGANAIITIAVPRRTSITHPTTNSPSISFFEYSDGYEGGFDPFTGDGYQFMSELELHGRRTISILFSDLATAGKPVTCVIYTMLVSWVADISKDLGVPSFYYWIQPASVLSIYYHRYRGLFSRNLPGLPPLNDEDLPSFFSGDGEYLGPYVPDMEKTFRMLDSQRKETRVKPRVLVNTFHELEADAIAGLSDYLDLLAVGPMVDDLEGDRSDLRHLNGGGRGENYMEWLDTKAEKSVVYVAFGSIYTLTARQTAEIAAALSVTGRPYIWSLRGGAASAGEAGLIVGWCDQARVLRHEAVGCFVTHGGWNSTTEGLAAGVPMVMVPQWSDQLTNARLVEIGWGVGIRVVDGSSEKLTSEELRRCIEAAMDGGDVSAALRLRAREWSEKARDALAVEGGRSVANLKTFLHSL